MSGTDQRNIERRQFTVTKVESNKPGDPVVMVVAQRTMRTTKDMEYESDGLIYLTEPDRAPRVGVKLNVTIEVLR